MTQASVLFGRVRSMLDDDNSVRYTETDDLVPAINSAIGYIQTVYSAAFEQKQLQPFALSELTEPWIFTPTVFGNTAKVNLNSSGVAGAEPIFNDKVWTIIGVDPNPSINNATPDTFLFSTNRLAKRLTMEEWNYALEDPFTPGYEDVPADFARACYVGPGLYGNTSDPYLMLRPASMFTESGDRVVVWVLLKHDTITAGTDSVKFPVTVHPLIEQKMLQYITYQNDDDRLFKITDKEVKELIQLMN